MHRIKRLTNRSTVNLSLDQLIHALNPILRGWTNYTVITRVARESAPGGTSGSFATQMVHSKTVTLWQTYKKSTTTQVSATASAGSSSVCKLQVRRRDDVERASAGAQYLVVRDRGHLSTPCRRQPWLTCLTEPGRTQQTPGAR